MKIVRRERHTTGLSHAKIFGKNAAKAKTDLWFEAAGDGGRLTKLGIVVPAPISAWEGDRIVDTVLPRRSQSSRSISSTSDDRLVSPLGCM